MGSMTTFVDSMTLALMRFRQGGFIAIHDEELPEETMPRKREYY